jgi:hypothetical protein
MKISKLKKLTLLTASLITLITAASAQVTPMPDPERVTAEVQMLDPWVPPATRKVTPAVSTQGVALQEQVERKLKQRFDSADVKRNGTLTRAQAEAAGLGFVVKNFDAIDTRKTGVVRFDDVKHYLREQGAVLK